jgi:hypothetical protein
MASMTVILHARKGGHDDAERRRDLTRVDMPGSIRRLFWVEVSAATITGTSALTTAIVPDWIELVLGWDPDQGDGSVEWLIIWLITAGLCFVTVVLVAAAMREWRRTSGEAST